jgi:hypothetical protein
MKTYFTKFRILLWVVLILTVLNLSVIGTLIYRYYNQRRIITRHLEMPMMRHQPPSYLKKELNLSDDQFRQFQSAREAHQEHMMAIHERLGQMRSAYLDELMKEHPDTLALQAWRDSIGNLHGGMMKATGMYYANIRRICNPNQVSRLNTFFKDAMMTEGTPMMAMPGMRHATGNPGKMRGAGRGRN